MVGEQRRRHVRAALGVGILSALLSGCTAVPLGGAPDSPVVAGAPATAAPAVPNLTLAAAEQPAERADGEPPVMSPPAEHEVFATMYVPRFGDDWVRRIGEGVSESRVLDREDINVGHYSSTQMPGAVGNFAIAAHRETHSGPFSAISDLRVGDAIIIETADGFYVYRYRSTEYVLPSGVGVLDATPQFGDADPGDRIITLTSCNPRMSTAERIIAYGILESWIPRESGEVPPEIEHLVG